MQVQDVMTTHIVTAKSDWSVNRVIELMLDEDVSSLLVVDDNDRLIGIVTESVLLVAAVDQQLRTDPISLHMERRFVSSSPTEPVNQTIEKFLLHRVRHFPVLDNGKLVGILTRRQLMRGLMGRQSNIPATA